MDEKVYFEFSVPEDPNEISLQDTKQNLEINAKTICELAEKIQNVTLKEEPKPCNKHDTFWIEETKYNVMKNLLQTNDDMNIVIQDSSAEVYVDLYKTLVKENQEQHQVLEYITQELKEEEALLDIMQESLRFMKNIEKTDQIDNENPELLNLKVLNTETQKKFWELKQNLHMVLNKCYGDDSMKTLVQTLTLAYFKGGDDKYIDVVDTHYLDCIQILKRASLIVVDPYNKTRIKFDDIL